MKNFKMHFSHPVRGKIYIIGSDEKDKHIFMVDTNENNILEVPLKGFHKGKWRVTFEWQYEGRDYCHEEDIQI